MKRFASPGMLAALVAANAALVFALACASTPREAHAIGGGANYVLAVGQSIGMPQEVVYLVDTESGQARAITVNAPTRKIELYGSRDIAKDLNGKAPVPK